MGLFVSRTKTSGGGGSAETDLWPNGSVTADSASQADVQSAVNAASDGQRVLIPDGSVTWTSGITTSKQILIRAENYTPTSGGSSSRSVNITNNSTSTALFHMTSGSTYHIGIAGIRFNEGTQATNYIRLSGSTAKVPLISDIYMEIQSRGGTSTDVAVFTFVNQGGVVWNSKFVGIGTNANGTGPAAGSSSIVIKATTSWESASTVGTLDTNGTTNIYVEDSSAFNVSNFPDADDNARWVCRYNDLDGTFGTTHGASSLWGGRHVEYYHNTLHVSDSDRNIAGRLYWPRAGEAYFHDETFTTFASEGTWGAVRLLDLGEVDEIPGPYLDDRQPGCGWEPSAYLSKPIYSWDHGGAGVARGYQWTVQDDWTSHIVGGRDVFPSSSGGANPGEPSGYPGDYTYPHPLRYTAA